MLIKINFWSWFIKDKNCDSTRNQYFSVPCRHVSCLKSLVIATSYSDCMNQVSGAGGFQVSGTEWEVKGRKNSSSVAEERLLSASPLGTERGKRGRFSGNKAQHLPLFSLCVNEFMFLPCFPACCSNRLESIRSLAYKFPLCSLRGRSLCRNAGVIPEILPTAV